MADNQPPDINPDDIVESMALTIANLQVAIAQRDATIKALQRQLNQAGDPPEVES